MKHLNVPLQVHRLCCRLQPQVTTNINKHAVKCTMDCMKNETVSSSPKEFSNFGGVLVSVKDLAYEFLFTDAGCPNVQSNTILRTFVNLIFLVLLVTVECARRISWKKTVQRNKWATSYTATISHLLQPRENIASERRHSWRYLPLPF
jgi:hypothetical protein